MASNITLKAIGLNTSPNQLDLPPGSLSTASNVIIRRDNVIEPRRGYKLYGTSMGSSSDRAKQLMTYKERILRHYSNILEFDTNTLNADGESIFAAFCGNYLEPETGRRIRFIEANGNFYFTTDEGIKKISAKTADDLTTACPFITQSGGIKALDVTARLNVVLGNQTGFLPQDSAVAYRIVWGSTDANNNLILGAPSQRAEVFNPLINLELQDFNRLLEALDNVSNGTPASLISDGDYVSTLRLPISASANELRTNLIALAAKLDTDILIADQVAVAPLQISLASINSGIGTISFDTGSPSDYWISGDKINLTGFSPVSGTLDGPQTISSLIPSFTTTGDTNAGLAEITDVTTVADVAGNLASKYFTFNSANDETQYYAWFKVSGTGTDPGFAGKTGIQVNINTNDADTAVATATGAAISSFTTDVGVSVLGNVVTLTNSNVGEATDATAGTSGFNISVTQQGVAANKIINIADTSGINVGVHITGTGIPAGTYVVSVGISDIVISQNATLTNTGVTLNFDPAINFTTSASGAVNTLNATINSYQYESIDQPGIPSTPATNQQLVDIQTYLQEIITQLQSEPDTGTPPIISSTSQTDFITPIAITTTATVFLTFTIPQDVTANNFYQIYRSDIAQATGTSVISTDVVPNDEMRLVFEGFPTSAQLSAGEITVEDITPDAFRGANLYTNATTGEGILQANDVPPFALDINRFKNVTFYANTRTRHRKSISLLGVSNMIDEYNGGTVPKITITDGVSTNTYSFVTGLNETTNITTVADVAGSLAGKYFTLNSAEDFNQYYFWYKVSGTGTDPMVANRTGIQIDISTNDSANTVAFKTNDAISVLNVDFDTSLLTNVVTVTNTQSGSTTDATAGTSGFTVLVTQQGRGEDASILQVLLSTVGSPAQAVDQTARSLVHVINANPNEIVYAYYLSGAQDVPGKILFEARTLNNNPFYILANNSVTGLSFNPDLSPSALISAISVASPTVITTSTPHGLINQDKVVISSTNSTPVIDGVYNITYISATQFSIPIAVTIAGTEGSIRATSTAITSDNEALKNRIYYSKILQPEAVPIVNTIDVGAKDKAILRIFPLRDSLFVFKEDGLFRISGETAPFNLALFDSSCILIPPDSLDVSNNLLYGWTTQGVVTVSEAGVSIISRPIDTTILKLATSQYVNFPTATWGIGYESDNSYTVYTIQEIDDVRAQIGFRYSNLTNSWTTFDKSDTCGVIDPANDTQYLGAGDTNFLEEERKNFNRTDYADREFVQQLTADNYFGLTLKLADVSNIEASDVLTQVQLMTIYQFNALLEKLDTDTSLSPHDYFSTNEMVAGDDPRIKLDDLIQHIADDPGRQSTVGFTPAADYEALKSIPGTSTITSIATGEPTVITTSTPHNLQTGRIIDITGSNSSPTVDGTHEVVVLSPTTFTIPISVKVPGTTGTVSVENNDFRDIKTSYNMMINLLNNDAGVFFYNYVPITTQTLQEVKIVNVNITTKKITTALQLNFMIGPLTIYKHIDSVINWGSETFGDSLSLKHVRESTLMFENRAFSDGLLSFSSDLLPAFQNVPFKGTNNGIFGFAGIPYTINGITGPIGFGYGFFGGISNSAPFRTYIPRNVQRCRYINAQFTHSGAREFFSIFGITMTAETGQSSRAYR